MATVNFRRRKPQASEHPGRLYVQVIQHRSVSTQALPFRVYEEEWDNKNGCIVYPPHSTAEKVNALTEILQHLNKEMELWEHVVARLDQRGDYASEDVIREYKRNRDSTLLTSVAARKIWMLRASGAVSTAYNYLGVVKQFLKFVGSRELHVQDISRELLLSFSSYLHSKGVSRNTVSFYFRILRALWNLAVHRELIPLKISPFHVVFTGTEKTPKRAVKEEIINRLVALSGLSEGLDLARNLFLFCFYAQGMSFIDLAHLTRDNIRGEYLIYSRRKSGCELSIKLLPCMLSLLEKYKHNGTPYLFPVLKGGRPSYKEYESALRLQNKRLKTLAAVIDRPDLKLTTYVARHSWASIAHEKGVQIEVISRALGHTSIETTCIYVAYFDNQKVDNANKLVVMGSISQKDEKLFSHD